MSKAPDEIAKSERRLQALLEKSSEGFALLGADGRFVQASKSAAHLLGCEPSSIADALDLVHPDDRELARAALERVKHSSESVTVRLRMLHRDSVRLFEFVLANRLRDPDVAGIVSNFRDVTELENVRDERDCFFELSADLLCIVRPDGFFERLNAAWETALGWTREELMERPYIDRIHPDDRAETLAVHQEAFAAPITSFECRYQCRDGSYRWLQWKSSFDGATGRVYGIGRDVTDKKRLDEHLLNARKMEAIGRLAGGVAHDINNMLSVIYASTEHLLMTMPESDPARTDIVEIHEVAQRSAALVRKLLAFGRKRARSVRDVDLDRSLEALTRLVARCAGPMIHVIARPDTQAYVRIDPSELESVVMNLALNARDAMPSGGMLEVASSMRILGAVRARELGVDPGRYVALTVRDTGCGIPSALRHKLFEPFFTTKDLGKGTGLGLATVFGIVQECNGAVEVESTEGVGTTLTVLLPCLRRTTPRPRASLVPPSAAAR